MTKVLGEQIMLGVGPETTRGTPVAPTIWIPGVSPATMGPRVEKVDVRETRNTRLGSQGAEIITRFGGGELEYYIRNKSFGYILRSHYGSMTSGTKAGDVTVYQHTASILLNSIQHPSLTIALAIPGSQHYQYALSIAKTININIERDLVKATTEFKSISQAEIANYTPTYGSDDYYFRHQDVTIKLATDLAGLTAAIAFKVKSLSFSSDNGAEENLNVGALAPDDILAKNFEIGGDFNVDFEDKTYHDLFYNNTYKAMRITILNNDVTIGSTSRPKIEIDLAKVSFSTYDNDRPIDDILKDTIGYKAHFSIADSKAITVLLENMKTNYTS